MTTKLDPSDVDIVIYHGKCSDGFGSALASYMYFKKTFGVNKNGNTVEYYPAYFYASPPDITNKNVLICDFSYKSDITLSLIKKAKNLLILDHHKSAKLELDLIPDNNKVFDMNHSGAYLTWKYFFPDTEVPLLIKYIEDNDIWLKKLPNTREITSYIFSLPFEFDAYAKLLDETYLLTDIVPTAIGMQRQNNMYLEQAMTSCTKKFMKINKKYYLVAHINSSILKSEIGNCIFEKFPDCDFSAIYSLKDSKTYISFRSTDERADVSVIATSLNGGGHRNASSICVFSSVEIPGELINNNSVYKLVKNIYTKLHSLSKLNIVYLNASDHKKHIGKYLLQNRQDDKFVQEACSIIRNRLNDRTYCEVFDVSCVWHYDGENNKQWFTITYREDIKLCSIKDYFSIYDDYESIDSEFRVVFSKPGLNLYLY